MKCSSLCTLKTVVIYTCNVTIKKLLTSSATSRMNIMQLYFVFWFILNVLLKKSSLNASRACKTLCFYQDYKQYNKALTHFAQFFLCLNNEMYRKFSILAHIPRFFSLARHLHPRALRSAGPATFSVLLKLFFSEVCQASITFVPEDIGYVFF